MARFTGAGKLQLSGARARIYDCRVTNGGLDIISSDQRVQSCEIGAPVAIESGSQRIKLRDNDIFQLVTLEGGNNGSSLKGNTLTGVAVHGSQVVIEIADNTFRSEGDGIEIDATGSFSGAEQIHIADNDLLSQEAPAVRVLGDKPVQAKITANTIANCQRGVSVESDVGPGEFTSGHRITVDNNDIIEPNRHGIYVLADRTVVRGNVVEHAGWGSSGDWDGIHIAADECTVESNRVKPLSDWATTPVTRYGIHVASGDGNVVVANHLGAAADYDSGPLENAGTNTILEFPSDATYGDNFTH